MGTKYDKATISKAGRLYRRGVSLRKICRDTGIKSTSTIQFHFDPEYRKEHIARQENWRRKHPKEWAKICKKASAKMRRKNNGKK